jgi:uncharacterized protein YggU (UPF0235/DUF167 family)
MHEREFKITKAEEGAAFAVLVVPKAVKNEVVGKHGDALKIHLTSNNVGGIANDTLINFISEKLEVKSETVEIAGGLTTAEKMVIVVGLSPGIVEERLLA